MATADNKHIITAQAQFTKAQLGKIESEFKLADKNKDGSLDYEEFKKIFNDLPGEESQRVMFSSFDKDGSGKISAMEFWTTLVILSKASPTEKLEMLFDFFDTDKSGALVNSEITSITAYITNTVKSIYGSAALAQIAAAEIVGELDVNKDGKITKEEYVQTASKYPELVSILGLNLQLNM